MCLSKISSRECVPHSLRAPVPFLPSRPLEHPSQEPTTTHSTPIAPRARYWPIRQKTNPRRVLTSSSMGCSSRSKRTQGRAAGDHRVWLASNPSKPGLAASPAETEGRMDTRLWDHKLVKATCTAGLVISGAWSSTPGVVGANVDRRRGSCGH